jgi:hypothetical protein
MATTVAACAAAHPPCLELLDGVHALLVLLACGQVHHTIRAFANLAQQVIALL